MISMKFGSETMFLQLNINNLCFYRNIRVKTTVIYIWRSACLLFVRHRRRSEEYSYRCQAFSILTSCLKKCKINCNGNLRNGGSSQFSVDKSPCLYLYLNVRGLILYSLYNVMNHFNQYLKPK